MGIVFKNNAKTTLGSSLTNSATSATVTDGSVFPSLAAGEFFFCTFDDGTNNEIVKVTARSSNTLTIVRAQESTTARAFSSGDAAELRLTAGVLETIQENIAAKSANQTVFNATTSGGATSYDIGIDPGVEANAMVFLDGVMQHHDTFSFSSSTLTFDAAPVNGTKLEVIVDNLINLQSSNLTVDSFTAADVSGSPQTDFTLSDTPAAETNLIVFVDGVFQDQDAYTISNNTLTITTGVIAGRGVTVYVINPVNIGTPSDGTVTSAKLSGNITMPGTLTVGSNDVAFDSPTFVVDNSNSRVGLGTASPSVPVDIVGDVKMSANLTVDTSTLVVDSSNNRVGIGATSPDSPLEIDGGSAANTVLHLTSTTANTFLKITDSNTNEGNFIGCATDDLTFFTKNTLRWSIGSTGHLTGASGSKIVQTIASGGGNFLEVTHTGNEAWSLAVQSGTGADDYLDIGINGGTRAISIHEDGKIGIGTTAPNSALHIADGGSGSDGGSVLTLSQTGFGSIVNNDDLGSIHFGGVTSGGVGIHNAGKIMVEGDATWASNDYPTRMTFHTTKDAASSSVERMRINNLGYVAIGGEGDDPTHRLTVKTSSADSATSLVVQRIWNENQGWAAESLTEYYTDLDNASYPRAQIGFYRGDTSNNDSSGFIVKTGTSNSGMATRFKVTATGMVEMPEQPAFMAKLTSSQTITSSFATVAFNSESFDRKSNHASGVFTAPHAGVYLFGANFLVYPWTSGIFNFAFYKDGSNYSGTIQAGAQADSHSNVSHQCLIECNANDEITVRVAGSSMNAGAAVYGSQAYWWGYMVG